jgi:glycosyltransferase involved in cell wall biosynthesis
VLQDEDVVCISSIDWDFIWQGHQHIMSTLAAHGNRVLFIENTGVRRPGWRDLRRLRHRAHRWWTGTQGLRREAPGITVLSPLILPWPYSRVARTINRAVLSRAVGRWSQATRGRRPIVWTFLPTPLARDLMKALAPKVSIYYCIDDLPASSRVARRLARTEPLMFREVDLVFVTSEGLRRRAASFSDRVHRFPFGVDYPAFERTRGDGGPPSPLVGGLPRPVVGYVGGIHRWIDQPLLAEAARRLPQVTFALVGPPQTDVGDLVSCPNVSLLGPCSHADVPRCLKGFDAAVIPYRLTDYTASVYPTKLNEYLAMGLPVVSTDLPEIRRFNRDHGDVVTVAATVEEFVAGVRRALEPSPAEVVTRRLEVAWRNRWEARLAQMSGLIEARLAGGVTR